ncbi:MAG: 3-deoxy-D-manno-octulosonic acid transferase [Candidatus Azobacteroides sp.]|nr:3-deoxy-D-manno-octulosonic acid transferase [Candidatus Azobacteroides sp.]
MYSIAIILYALVVRLVAPFNKKAKKMLVGQRKTFSILKNQLDPNASYIWFHAASLGEFEQGRPLMEKIKKEKPEYKILLTFFSPSGYEIRKDYPGADMVCYLPFDHYWNARKFLRLVKPVMAVFIKYEFWMNYLNQLKRLQIPTYIISAVFRPSQIFFRWYAYRYRKVLNNYTWFFVQDQPSMELLKQFNHNNVSITGDTRFDRVYEIFEQRKELPLVAKFLNQTEIGNDLVFVAGSTWVKDEAILIPYFNRHPEIKLIIAPHEICEQRIETLISRFTRPVIRYSQASESAVRDADCLIIDCFGLLSSIYRYGNWAYIGGGFGKGIHNILEAAVYGIPVMFGPNYRKFKEAKELIACQGAFSVTGEDEFSSRMNDFLSYADLTRKIGKNAKEYVIRNLGATLKIYEKIFP